MTSPTTGPIESAPKGGTLAGVAWMVASIACFTGSLAIVRHLGDALHVFEIVFFRGVFGIVVMLPWLARTGLGGLKTRRLPLCTLRSVIAATNLALLFFALTLLPVADVSAIIFIRPMFTIVIAMIVLHEAASGRQWRAIFVGFGGALLIIQPGFAEINVGALAALAAALTTATAFTIAKLLTRTEPVDRVAFYQTFLMVPVAAIPAALVWTGPSWEQLGWLFGIGLLATASHRLMNRAYVTSELTFLQPLEFVRLPIAAVLGWVVFAEFPDSWVWVGGAVIFAASIYGTRGSLRRE